MRRTIAARSCSHTFECASIAARERTSFAERCETPVTSSDVIHSFWIPDMLFKRDAIPGQVSAFDLQPRQLGTFVGRCAQFCGLDHAMMTFSVRVVPADEFDRWRTRANPR